MFMIFPWDTAKISEELYSSASGAHVFSYEDDLGLELEMELEPALQEFLKLQPEEVGTIILRVFYEGVQAVNTANKIDSIKQIQELWDDYLAKLPTALKDQAMPLTSLVVYAPRTISMKFADIMKAALLISIPDRLMQKAKINLDRGREDQKLGEMKFSADRSSNTVTLTANLEEENKKNFENFVRDNELKSKTSKFENFLCYVEPTTIIDKYTVARCAMQFIDTFRNDIFEILNDTEVKAALIASEISPVTIIKALSDRYAYYLECYMLERRKGNDLLTAKFNQLISDVLGKLSGDGVKDVNFNFTASSAANSNMETLVQEYVDYFKAGIRLQVAPAISEQDKQRQAFVYRNSVAIRDANSGEQVRLRENFSCYDPRLSIQSYIPGDIALNLQSVVDQAQHSDVSDTQILEALFANNLPFLRQLNKEKSGDELYQLALLSLWDAFVIHESCPAQIKTRQDEIREKITPDNP
nr:hypothetical protein [Gammaproteobacteria bacterium]